MGEPPRAVARPRPVDPALRYSSSGSSARAWEQIQVTVFTRWVNSLLEQRGARIESLEEDFRDGVRLCIFAEIVTGKPLKRKYSANPKAGVQFWENCNLAIEHLKQNCPGIKMPVNIDGRDISDGKLMLILGLLRSVVGIVSVDKAVEGIRGKGESGTAALLRWCKERGANYPGVSVDDFSKSWKDGRAFLAIIHSVRPDIVGDWKRVMAMPPEVAVRFALDCARELGFHTFFEAEELLAGDVPDEHAITTQVAELAARLIPADKRREIEQRQVAVRPVPRGPRPAGGPGPGGPGRPAGPGPGGAGPSSGSSAGPSAPSSARPPSGAGPGPGGSGGPSAPSSGRPPSGAGWPAPALPGRGGPPGPDGETARLREQLGAAMEGLKDARGACAAFKQELEDLKAQRARERGETAREMQALRGEMEQLRAAVTERDARIATLEASPVFAGRGADQGARGDSAVAGRLEALEAETASLRKRGSDVSGKHADELRKAMAKLQATMNERDARIAALEARPAGGGGGGGAGGGGLDRRALDEIREEMRCLKYEMRKRKAAQPESVGAVASYAAEFNQLRQLLAAFGAPPGAAGGEEPARTVVPSARAITGPPAADGNVAAELRRLTDQVAAIRERPVAVDAKEISRGVAAVKAATDAVRDLARRLDGFSQDVAAMRSGPSKPSSVTQVFIDLPRAAGTHLIFRGAGQRAAGNAVE